MATATNNKSNLKPAKQPTGFTVRAEDPTLLQDLLTLMPALVSILLKGKTRAKRASSRFSRGVESALMEPEIIVHTADD